MQNKTGQPVASIIMAAGRGSRMKNYSGSKTLLPLDPAASVYEGHQPIILYLMDRLPDGPKAIIVNHCKSDVMAATRASGAAYIEQPVLNGTGGAILAAGDFINSLSVDAVIITMGDVPFVKKETYLSMADGLSAHDLMILGFSPVDKKQYGVLEIDSGKVKKITEWKYWRDYPAERQAELTVCNSGIYAVRRPALMHYLPILASRPQIVQKKVNGKLTDIEEFFFTDMIEYMVQDGKPVGYHVVDDEMETMGVDDIDALQKAQAVFKDSGFTALT
jgi:bifunctional UDP-N-acetylglucosamine pyrophosphorylase/glucosamine-1-phosphate N-acetyltransferase